MYTIKFLNGTTKEFADLSSADLSGADLSYANLSSADLSSADLRDADLRRADLSDANLMSANLRSAKLNGANLSSADLSGAYLSGAYLSYANLSNAKNLILGCQRSDGYLFYLSFIDNKWLIYAGCRRLSIEQYKEHIKTYNNEIKEAETKAIITYLETRLEQYKNEHNTV